MGYSCTAKAASVMDTFNGGDQTCNTWTYNGRRYFYERGGQNADGTITAAGIAMTGGRGDSFKISPEGEIIRAPHGMKACLNPTAGLVNYLRIHEPRALWRLACEYDDIPTNTSFAVFSNDNPYK